MSEPARMQPVMLVIDRRIECECGVLAVFITGKVVNDQHNLMEGVSAYCQACFERVQEEQEA